MSDMTLCVAPFTGAAYWKCECGWKCHYWEDESDLAHDCKEEK
jgi:hypothetical protein